MKPGPATSVLSTCWIAQKLLRDQHREFARILASVLRKHHRGVGRKIAVRFVARRLDHDAAHVGDRLDRAGGRKISDRFAHALGE